MRFVSNLLRRTDACASRWFDRGSIFGIWKKNLLDCDSVLPGVAQSPVAILELEARLPVVGNPPQWHRRRYRVASNVSRSRLGRSLAALWLSPGGDLLPVERQRCQC